MSSATPALRVARPGGIEAAVALLRDEEDARPLAGGQSLLPTMRLGLAAPALLIDLSAIDEMRSIRADGDGLWIGAMCTHSRVAADPMVRARLPALARLALGIADRQVRNRGTIGGSLANADPAACHPAGALGFGAVVVTDRREIAADAFFTGLFSTALAGDELIVAIRYPRLEGAAYEKIEQPASRFALLGLALGLTRDGPRVAITGGGFGVFRATPFESAIAGALGREAGARPHRLPPDILDIGHFIDDLHASASYRRHLAGVLLRRALARAMAP